MGLMRMKYLSIHKQLKNNKGLTLTEVVLSFALFVLLVAITIPMLTVANSHQHYAKHAHIAHHQAQHLMLSVRDAVRLGDVFSDAVRHYTKVQDITDFSVWLRGQKYDQMHSHTRNENFTFDASWVDDAASVVVVIIWGASGNIAGQAVGIIRYDGGVIG